jgi:hypothetical protein
MDFWSAWKIISIASTGAFGILGLVTEFKDPDTKKLTRWGVVSLVGILASTVLGAAAQWKQTSDEQKKIAADTAKTLAITGATKEAVENIQRVLTPFGEPEFHITLESPCNDELEPFCKKVDAAFQKWARKENFNERTDDPLIWKAWPSRIGVGFALQVKMYRGPLGEGDEPPTEAADLQFDLFPWMDVKSPGSLYASVTNQTLILQLNHLRPQHLRSSGRISSTRDLPGSIMVVEWAGSKGISDMRVSAFSFLTQQGQFFELNAKRFKLDVQPPDRRDVEKAAMLDPKHDKQDMPKFYDDVEFLYRFDQSDSKATVPPNWR